MHISYLIDGYNLLFAFGMLDRRAGTKGLQNARGRLLDLLDTMIGKGDHDITVVFDSGRTKSRPSQTEHGGLHVQFSGGGEFADDVIEATVARCTCPDRLVVVSNDRRLQQAARRRGAHPWSTDDFLEHFEASPTAPAPVLPEPERADPPTSREEIARWLAEFGDVANDPEFRELFEPYPFDDPEE